MGRDYAQGGGSLPVPLFFSVRLRRRDSGLFRFNAGKISGEKGLTNGRPVGIMTTTTKQHKPVTERSTRRGRPLESPRWWKRGGERLANGLRRADRTAAEPSRDRRASHPLSIGARMMVRVSERTFYTSIWVVSQKQQLLSHMWGKGFFICLFLPGSWQNPGHLPPKIIIWRKIP